MNGKRKYILSFLFSLVFLFSCSDMFQEKIPQTNANSPGSLGDMFKTQEDAVTRLEPPTQLYIAPFYSRSEIRLSWEASMGASYYMIERAASVPEMKGSSLEWEEPGEESYEILERFVYGRSYTDEVVKNPTLDSPEYVNRYYYRISAFNPGQNLEESEPCKPEYGMLFRAPSNIRASGGASTDYIEVRWGTSENAVSYEVWRSTSEKGLPVSLGTVSSNQTYYINSIGKDEQGKDFYYIVTARNSFGNISLQTKPAIGFSKVEGAPDSPKIRRSEGYGRGNSVSGTQIEWASVENAKYYMVYRFSKDGKTGTIESSLTRLASETTATLWPDTAGLRPGTYYYYRVRAVGKEPLTDRELSSPFSGPDPSKSFDEWTEKDLDDLAESFILSPPDTVIAEKGDDGKVTVKWLPPVGGDKERQSYIYTVYADTSDSGTFTEAVSFGIGSQSGEGGYIYARDVPLDKGQYFRIKTFYGGIGSAPSVVVTPVPAPAIIQGASQRAFISPDAAANANGVYPVRITWKKPEKEDPYFYNVYRSTRADGGFAKINEQPLKADGTGNTLYSLDGDLYSFIDRNDTAKAGKKYYYRVVSLNILGDGNLDWAGIKEGYGALTHEQYILEFNKTMSAALKKLTLMYKSGNTDKLGSETKNGALGGTISYNAAIDGLGARIIIKVTDYAEFYIENEQDKGRYFTLNGNSNTSANMSSNGTMDGTVNCTGMYPGRIFYDGVEIKGGAAGGGSYGVEPEGFTRKNVPYTILN